MSTNHPMPELRRLAEFVADLRFADLPAAVVARAQLVLADTIGVIVGGMAEPEVARLAAYAAQRAPGKVSLLAHRGRTTAPWAAMVHGTAGTTLEMDEGHAYARGHAAIHALPPALALAEQHGASGQQLLTAFVAGYEAAARVGIATRLRPAVHPFGAWGVLGSAAVACWFNRLDAAQIADALEVAASFAIAPSFATAFQGANVRNTYAGTVNMLGMQAVDLYQLGFTGEQGALQTTFGRILGEQFDPAGLVEELGSRFEMMRGYFKPYSACRYTHAAIDAVLALRERLAAPPDSIARIDVETYQLAARLNEPQPRTALAGRFSTPFVVAATWLHGSAGPEIFTEPVLRDPAVLKLAGRVHVREDPALSALTPQQRPARVRVQLVDGANDETVVYSSPGDRDRPLDGAKLAAKFRDLTSGQFDRATIDQLWQRLTTIAAEPAVGPLVQLLRQTGSAIVR